MKIIKEKSIYILKYKKYVLYLVFHPKLNCYATNLPIYQSTNLPILFKVLLIFFISFYLQSLNSQTTSFCGTTAGPDSIGDISNLLLNITDDPYYIRIYIHVITKDDGTGGESVEGVNNALGILYNDFKDFNIFFVWEDCEINYIANTDLFNNPIPVDIFNLPQNNDGIDIFISSRNANPFTTFPAAAAGIPSTAFYISSQHLSNPSYLYYITTSVVSHEMGHCLGLYHTHQEHPNCTTYVNGHNCLSCGDFVCDTPADPRIDGVEYPACEWNKVILDPLGQQFQPDIDNIMSYSHPGCLTKFTEGQGNRMRAIISITPLLQNCLITPDPNYIGRTISTNETWTSSNTPNNGDVLIGDDLIIESGGVLTIESDVVLRFRNNSRLIVKPNGKLILHGELTAAKQVAETGCGMDSKGWKGVEAWGNSSKFQHPQNQGDVRLRPGSKISNAETAVKLYGPSISDSGGLLFSNLATFKNNHMGIKFAPYTNFSPFPGFSDRNYVASINRTEFIIDEDYMLDQPFSSFIYMVGVKGVSMSANQMKNLSETVIPFGGNFEDRGYGVRSYDSQFTVSSFCLDPSPTLGSPCNDLESSVFEGLGYAVHATTVFENKPFAINGASFQDCIIGIRNTSVSGSSITECEFFLTAPNVLHLQSFSRRVGIIYEYDISSLVCEENSFFGPSNEDIIYQTGIFANNTGIANKAIRRNTFNNNHISVLVNGINAAFNPDMFITGLHFECNTFTNGGWNNLRIDGDIANIRDIQGGLTTIDGVARVIPTRNYFPGYRTAHIVNRGQNKFRYLFKYDAVDEDPYTYHPGFTSYYRIPSVYHNECDPPVGFPEIPTDDLDLFKIAYEDHREEFESIINGSVDSLSSDEELQVAYHRGQMDRYSQKLTIGLLQDSLYHHPDTLNTWIRNLKSIEGDMWLVKLLLLDDKISEAITVLDSAIGGYHLTEVDYFNIQDLKSLVSILDGKPLYNLDSLALNWVESFVDSDGYAEAWARSISSLYGGYYPPELIITDTTEFYSLEMPSGNHTPSNEFDFTVYPNPANTFVNVNWKSLDFNENYTLNIYDLNGRLIQKQSRLPSTGSYTWYPEETVSGVYIFQMETGGKILKSEKVIISR